MLPALRKRLTTAALLVWITLFVGIRAGVGQEEQELTSQETKAAQEVARHFVGRMQQTRNVATLFDELFLPGFVSHFTYEEGIAPALFSRLTRSERQRLFTVMFDINYLSAVTIISDHDDLDLVYGEKLQKPRTLLPHSTILKLKRALHLRNGETELKTYQQFRLFMPAIEKALAEARAYLKRRGLEQTPEFQKHLISNERLGTGVNYRVRAYIGGQNIKDCDPLVGFASNQKFFRVELPLLIAAILTKDGEQLKIVRLTFVDGD